MTEITCIIRYSYSVHLQGEAKFVTSSSIIPRLSFCRGFEGVSTSSQSKDLQAVGCATTPKQDPFHSKDLGESEKETLRKTSPKCFILLLFEVDDTYTSTCLLGLRQCIEAVDSLNILELLSANFTDLKSVPYDSGLVTPDIHVYHPPLSIDVFLLHINNN
jgi:hypothetical protein